jgi:hypothetical protein
MTHAQAMDILWSDARTKLSRRAIDALANRSTESSIASS